MAWSLYEFCNPSVNPSSNGIKIYLKVNYSIYTVTQSTHRGRSTSVKNHRAIEGRFVSNITKWWGTTTFNWASCYLNKLDVSQVVIDGWYLYPTATSRPISVLLISPVEFFYFSGFRMVNIFFQYHWSGIYERTPPSAGGWKFACTCLERSGGQKSLVLANRIIWTTF